MISPATISEYIDRQVAAFKKIALRDFLIDLKTQFYPEQDISFMDEFLKMSKEENKGQFIVHHEKLYEYGATKSMQSTHVKDRLEALNMVEGEDFELTKSRELRKQGGTSTKKVYMLTPRTFKRILIGATRHSSHDVDVTMYADYYLFLEEAVGYYMDYQLRLEKALSVAKDGTIDRLSAKIDDQTAKIDELLSYGKNIQEELGEVREEVMDVKHHYGNLYDVFEDVHEEMVSTKKTVKKVAEHLEEKSFASTMNPDPEGLHHNALVMFKKIGQNYTVNNIAGQSAYVNTRKAELEIDGFTTMIDKFYQANPIDFRRNVQQAVNGHIDKVLEPLNTPIIAAREALKREIDEHNLMLQEDIPLSNERLAERVRVFNLTATGRDVIRLVNHGTRYAGKYNKTFARVRFYENEMRKYKLEVRNPKYKLKTLPIKVCSRFIIWSPNSLISFETLKELIHGVNKKTQKSPYHSDDE